MLDESTGLYFYNARYYDPALGRFIQADTIVPDPMNPQQLNRYSYVLNNPLRYTDPSGHAICVDPECTQVVHPVTGEIIQWWPAPPPVLPTLPEPTPDLPTSMPTPETPEPTVPQVLEPDPGGSPEGEVGGPVLPTTEEAGPDTSDERGWCPGGVVTGLIGFGVMVPMDLLLGAVSIEAALSAPPAGLVLVPVDTLALYMHVRFAQLAYVSLKVPCPEVRSQMGHLMPFSWR